MKICVDGRAFGDPGDRGVAHYAGATLDALKRAHPEDEWRVVSPSWSASLRAALLRRPTLDRLAGGCDVVWAPAPVPLAVSPGVPLVLTVHDRSWEHRPQDFTPYERAWHVLARPRALARRADRVVVTTRTLRDDLVAAWGLVPSRIAVTPLAPAVEVTGERADGDPYFLFVGALEPRKAPDLLAEAVALARADGLRARVVAVGKGRVAVPGVELPGRVDAARLSALYAGAIALVAPSRLEGYGLPAVEALAHGTPAIVTDLAEVREALGARATFVPVDDAPALAAALLDHERAPRRATPVPGLSWEATAERTYAALRDAAGA